MAIPSTVNLKDNIENEELKIESFIAAAESNEYLSKLPGISDLVLKLKGVFDSIKGFIGKILSIIDAVAKFLNLNAILSALGIGKLLDFIFNLIGDNFLGLGGSLYDREALRDLFKDRCMTFNENITDITGFKFGNLLSFSLMAILIGMLCANIPNAYSSLYTLFGNNEEYTTVLNDRDGYISERNNIYGLDSTDIEVKDAAVIRYDALTTKIETKDTEYNGHMYNVDKLFSKTFGTVMGKDSGDNAYTVLTDISTINRPFAMAKQTNKNIGHNALTYLDKDQKNHKDKVLVYDNITGMMTNLSPNYTKLDGEVNLSRVRNHPFLHKASKSKAVSEPLVIIAGNDYSDRITPDAVLNLL